MPSRSSRLSSEMRERRAQAVNERRHAREAGDRQLEEHWQLVIEGWDDLLRKSKG